MNWLLAICVLIGVLATAEDLWRRQISNKTTVAAFGLGLAAQTALHGLKGTGNSLAGTFIGFMVFFVFFLLGGMGAGDIKLMGGFGAVLGASQTLQAAFLTAIVGALFAMLYLLVRKMRKPQTTPDAGEREAIPYAPAITVGVLLSFAAR
jgi:prepilin peptidase CpaA